MLDPEEPVLPTALAVSLAFSRRRKAGHRAAFPRLRGSRARILTEARSPVLSVTTLHSLRTWECFVEGVARRIWWSPEVHWLPLGKILELSKLQIVFVFIYKMTSPENLLTFSMKERDRLTTIIYQDKGDI